MPNRIIKESINESRSLSDASFFAEDLYKRLITYADDYGRFNADCQIILARLYPREIQIVSESDIEDALIELSGAGKIAFYTASPRKEIYGCFPNWAEHQRIRESKNRFPDPEDTGINDWYLRRFVPAQLKQKIIERDGFKCALCGKYITTVQDSKRLIKMGAGLYHIDHIVPVSQGGRATEENLRLTCPQCNLARKRKYSVEEILEITVNEKEFAGTCGKLPQPAAGCRLNPIQSESNLNRKENARVSVEEYLAAYPVEGNRHLTETAFISCLMTGGVEEGDLVAAAKNYAESCRNLGKKEKYIKKPENFLKDMEYCQYLPGIYTPPRKNKRSKDKWSPAEQRDYDFAKLEKELVDN